MFKELKKHPVAVIVAALIHVAIALIVVTQIRFDEVNGEVDDTPTDVSSLPLIIEEESVAHEIIEPVETDNQIVTPFIPQVDIIERVTIQDQNKKTLL